MDVCQRHNQELGCIVTFDDSAGECPLCELLLRRTGTEEMRAAVSRLVDDLETIAYSAQALLAELEEGAVADGDDERAEGTTPNDDEGDDDQGDDDQGEDDLPNDAGDADDADDAGDEGDPQDESYEDYRTGDDAGARGGDEQGDDAAEAGPEPNADDEPPRGSEPRGQWAEE